MCKSKETTDSKAVHVFPEDSDDGDLYLNVISTTKQFTSYDWIETLKIGDKFLKIKLDSGAQCNVISERIAKKLQMHIKPSKTKRLISFSEHTINVIGEVDVHCQAKNKSDIVTFKIVRQELSPILGRKSCQQLGFML